MMAKANKQKPVRLQKSTEIISTALKTQWCYVNTENEFSFMNQTFVIADSVEEYKVHNKAFETEDYTNEAYMEEILVVINQDGDMRFYNQNYDLVRDVFVRVGM